MEIVRSVNGVPIRLTDERWIHIIENHNDLAGYYDEVLSVIESPDYIVEGYGGTFVALRQVKTDKFLAVVYREISNSDGFIITAYFTSKMKLERETIVWQREN